MDIGLATVILSEAEGYQGGWVVLLYKPNKLYKLKELNKRKYDKTLLLKQSRYLTI